MKKQLIIALFTAVLLRIVWSMLIPVMPISDSFAYDTFARVLVKSGVYGWNANSPFAYWPPGTSFLYAAIFHLLGTGYGGVVSINIAMSLGLMITSARIAKRLYSERVGVLTAWVIAVWPTLICFVTILASELPFVFLITLALDCWISGSSRRYSSAALTGLLLGAAALVRPLALALPLIFGLSSLMPSSLNSLNLRDDVIRVATAILFMAAVVAPWTIRNTELYGKVVLVSTNGGSTLWMGNTPGTNGGYMDIPPELSAMSDSKRDAILGARAKAYILSQPGAFAMRSVSKAVKLYDNESIGVNWNSGGITKMFGNHAILLLKRFTQLSWALIFTLAVLGLFRTLRATSPIGWLASPLVLATAFFTLVYAVTVSQDRYHLSFASVIAIFAAAGLAYLAELRKSLKPPRAFALKFIGPKG